MRTVNLSIRNKLFVLFLVFSVIPMIIVGTSSYYNARDSLQSEQIKKLEQIADMKAERLEVFFVGLKNDIDLIKSDAIIRKNLPIVIEYADDRSNPIYHSAEQELDFKLELLTLTKRDISNTNIMDIDGDVVYVQNPGDKAQMLGNPLYDPEGHSFEEGKSRVHFSGVYEHRDEPNKFRILVTGPVFSEDGELLGVITLEVDLSDIYDSIQDTKGLGKTGETLIGKKEGETAVFLNPLRHDKNAALIRTAVFGKKDAFPIQQAVQGFEGSGISVDYRGEEIIAAWRYIPALDWGVVAKIDTSEAFAPVVAIKNLAILFVIAITAIVGALAIIISNSISKPILDLSKGTEIIGMGNLDYRLGTDSTDEIGQLSRSIDEMTEKIKTVTVSRDELAKEIIERKQVEDELKKHREHLEDLVEERTNDLSEANKKLKSEVEYRKKTEEKLKIMNEELESFSYSVSHDLRAPLRAINGFSSSVIEDYSDKLDAKGQHYLNQIAINASKMGQLIDDLLNFSRLGRQEIMLSNIAMEKLAKTTFEEIKSGFPDRKLWLKVGKLPPAKGDQPMIHQVFVNLIDNAIKFTAPKEKAVIEVGGGGGEGDQNVYYVKDNGVGFDMKYVDKLFGVFQRLHSVEEFAGTGVGLAIVKRIINRHDGRVWAKGEINEGATFYFTLPNIKKR